MTHPSFFFDGEFGERFPECWIVEQRIVTKPAAAAGGFEDGARAFGFVGEGRPPGDRQRQDAAKSSFTVADADECSQQLVIVGGIGGIGSGKAR